MSGENGFASFELVFRPRFVLVEGLRVPLEGNMGVVLGSEIFFYAYIITGADKEAPVVISRPRAPTV